jgi:toxin ParE1/3/4
LKRLRNHPAAARELAKAQKTYDKAQPGLGRDLVLEVDRALSAVAEGYLPTLVHPEIREVRRVMLKRFPYWVVVLERPEEVVLVAVAHMKRRPNYWRRRLRSVQP